MPSFTSALAKAGGGALGIAAKTLSWRRPSPGDKAMRRLTAYFIVPIWIGAGFLDYLWHRRTRIETTSGLEEALVHSLMMLEAAPPVLAPLFFEIDSGVLASMIALSVLHEASSTSGSPRPAARFPPENRSPTPFWKRRRSS
jgi:hypothetical protein